MAPLLGPGGGSESRGGIGEEYEEGEGRSMRREGGMERGGTVTGGGGVLGFPLPVIASLPVLCSLSVSTDVDVPVVN